MAYGRKCRLLVGRSLIVVVALLATMSVGVGRAGIAAAQEASPSPTGTCEAPALPPGTPSPQEQMATPEAPEASPAAVETEAAGEATAVATEEAAQGTPADESTTATAAAGAQNIVNCINGGNLEGAVALMTTNFIQELFGTGNPYDVLAAGDLQGTQFANFATGAAETFADGSVGIDVNYLQTEYQFVAEKWTLVQDGEYWKIDSLESVTPEPEGDTAVLGFDLTEYAFTPEGAGTTTEYPVLMIHGNNMGQEAHEIVVLKLPEGMTVDQLLADESLFSQVEFIGQISLEPGQLGDMALVNLPAGKYSMVCFFTAPDGQSHAAKGMTLDFEVTPATPVETGSPAATPTS
jgi:uncharacterized cupredoxin-like copper-binding protein